MNLGDSSTSGWDSNVVVGNSQRQKRGEPLQSPLQNYPTYSDVMAQNDAFYVVNAGVPGFSSLQGAKYLDRLLSQFQRAGVKVDIVTIYFGNNDSAWNGNIADKYLLPGNGPVVHLARVYDEASKFWRVVPRVGTSDYGRLLARMSDLSRQYGAKCIFIEPVVPKTWPPGLRATGLEKELTNQVKRLKGTKIASLLSEAQTSFVQGTDALHRGDTRTAALLLARAQESDYLVPRIKSEYRATLHEVARSQDIPLVSVGNEIPLSDADYFIDYCHPIDPANRLIAVAIMQTIRSR